MLDTHHSEEYSSIWPPSDHVGDTVTDTYHLSDLRDLSEIRIQYLEQLSEIRIQYLEQFANKPYNEQKSIIQDLRMKDV